MPDAVVCDAAPDALRSMFEAEYAFARAARVSVRSAFLEYLAPDSWILEPNPRPGRAVYAAETDGTAQLDWYPSFGAAAASGELGFTGGPWVYAQAPGGLHSYGHFLTIWKRDPGCRWWVQIDGGISHAEPLSVEQKIVPLEALMPPSAPPPARFVAADAPARALADFQETAARDGFAAALRTYARDEDFLLLTAGEAPAGVGTASVHFDAHPIEGAWRETVRGLSLDSTLLYAVGELIGAHRVATHAYVQLWLYDPKVANWGLRVLLINPLPAAAAKA
jgi:hypothetical protein